MAQQAPALPQTQYNPTGINMGMGAVMPSGVKWEPLTLDQRKKLFVNDAFLNPRSMGGNFLWAAIDMKNGKPEEWRQGLPGYGMRFASRYGRSLTGNFIQHGGAALMGTEVRYICSTSKNPLFRIGHALAWQFVTLDSKGHVVFDLPGVSATYIQEMVGVQWMPGQTITGNAIRSANQQMITGAATNIVKEFLPDMKRMFKRKPQTAIPPPPAVPSVPPPPAP